MKRICTILSLGLVGAAVISAIASAHAPTARTSRAVEIELHHTSLGEILSTSSGFTLYEFSKDHGTSDSCVKISGCAQVWPALRTSGKPTAGSGVRGSLLSTTKTSGGANQVTYAGHPLYLYKGDSKAGDTSYVGQSSFGGTWYAINAAGHTVK